MSHTAESFMLTALTIWTVVYLVAMLIEMWADRGYTVGRYDNGQPRPVREVRR